jgi:hypothetical protein
MGHGSYKEPKFAQASLEKNNAQSSQTK